MVQLQQKSAGITDKLKVGDFTWDNKDIGNKCDYLKCKKEILDLKVVSDKKFETILKVHINNNFYK